MGMRWEHFDGSQSHLGDRVLSDCDQAVTADKMLRSQSHLSDLVLSDSNKPRRRVTGN